MFEQPPSLPMRAAIASILGSFFGIAMILSTHSVQAQAPAASESTAWSLGEATLAPWRQPTATLGAGRPGARGLHLNDSGREPTVGLRLQTLPRQTLRGNGEMPRSSDPLALGVQVRF